MLYSGLRYITQKALNLSRQDQYIIYYFSFSCGTFRKQKKQCNQALFFYSAQSILPRETQTKNPWLHSMSLRSSQESEMRRRNISTSHAPPDGAGQPDGEVGIQDQTSKATTKPQQQLQSEDLELPEAAERPRERPPVADAWSPLITNVCLCTALALSAYVCYRAYFH